VYSRISAIRNTSFDFEGILENAVTKEIIGENKAIHVWLDPRTNKPTPVPQDFRNLARKFEGDHCRIEPLTIIV
jgi:acyl-CoA thioesterase FadM